jgi:hypothetical protein
MLTNTGVIVDPMKYNKTAKIMSIKRAANCSSS